MKVEEATTSTVQSRANKDDNHFNFFLSPRHEALIDFNLENRPYYQPQPQGFTQDEHE